MKGRRKKKKGKKGKKKGKEKEKEKKKKKKKNKEKNNNKKKKQLCEMAEYFQRLLQNERRKGTKQLCKSKVVRTSVRM
ncbi:hypothetical protein EYC84_001027 [Monilinia fructicola]|uniref:Uncharacterized protein n=1 Tax=Monilinia fructicola TaxID=38448 RepID=A0A5M9JJC6_MONFR|nr:hypothetical protein EYC84_001027 [Monilinia fructicola]